MHRRGKPGGGQGSRRAAPRVCRWRRATLTNPDTTSTSYVFSYKNTKKGRAKRIYVRARDAAMNESDTTGRKIFRAR